MAGVIVSCEECGKPYARHLSKCPRCGERQNKKSGPNKKVEPKVEEKKQLIECTTCSHQISLYAKDCPSCGAPNKANPALKAALVIAGGFSIVWILFFIFIGLPILFAIGYLVLTILGSF